MQLADLVSVERVRCNALAAGKRGALETLSALMAQGTSLHAGEVLEGLLHREEQGSTGFGGGVAIPHARVKNTDRSSGAVLRLADAIEFSALDDQPVDLLFGLMVPESSTEDHLNLLAQLAEMFSNRSFVAALRAAQSPEALCGLIHSWRSGVA